MAISRDGLCAGHLQEADAARGTRAERGYGPEFDRARRVWEKREAKGQQLVCWRCGEPIPRGQTWHLGHADNEPGVIKGPEHARCNLEAAGKAGAETLAQWRAVVPLSGDQGPVRPPLPAERPRPAEGRTARRPLTRVARPAPRRGDR